MPWMDKTGPMGLGPMTGRVRGRCGMGRGFGRGLGRYFGWNAPQTKAEKKEALEDYRKALAEEMEDVEEELKAL
jgi:hypothetical protein